MSESEALALLRDAKEVLDRYWSTTVGDDYPEDYNNEDVIAMSERIDAFLKEQA